MSLPNRTSQGATARWFAQTARDIQEDYERIYVAARNDPQYAGHEAESAWKSLLERWLPPHYEVGVRKYILPDVSTVEPSESNCFETDIVIFNPTYPKPLREKAEVLSGGILAAFFVRLTIDADGIRDASKRAALLKKASTVRLNTLRLHLQGPFSVGLLAHSHSWKAEASAPFENVQRNLGRFNREFAGLPREVLDFTCIADLALWSTTFALRLPGMFNFPLIGLPFELQNGFVEVGISADTDTEVPPVARLVLQLIYRISYVDPTLRHWALGLLAALPVGLHRNVDWRYWALHDALPEGVIKEVQRRGFDNIGGGQNDWASIFA
uniref:DUF6602 domain-containing protein n=1 Tax=Cyanothece sp. (strain PCC 7425 / ATCC 29141) TaxID=395961 RepID=B8HJL3_CYAP4